MVGVTGFEPATPCTPCKYSTRLSYTPTAHEYYYVQPQNTNTFLGKDAYCSFAAIFVYYKCPDKNKQNNKKGKEMSKSQSKTCGCKNCSGMYENKECKKDKKPHCDK